MEHTYVVCTHRQESLGMGEIMCAPLVLGGKPGNETRIASTYTRPASFPVEEAGGRPSPAFFTS